MIETFFARRPRRLVVTEGGKLLDEGGNLAGASVAIESPKSQSVALSLVGSVDWIQASTPPRITLGEGRLLTPYLTVKRVPE